MEKAQKVLGFF